MCHSAAGKHTLAGFPHLGCKGLVLGREKPALSGGLKVRVVASAPGLKAWPFREAVRGARGLELGNRHPECVTMVGEWLGPPFRPCTVTLAVAVSLGRPSGWRVGAFLSSCTCWCRPLPSSLRGI